MANFETVEVNTDLLIVGGGFSACGAATEAAYWAKKNGLKVTVVDKAAMDRSGAVAMGLSAINQYIDLTNGQNTCEDYVKYVRQDLMGVAREDLVYSIARHVDATVHLFEKWGLPIWKDEKGGYVHEGRWQLMINGESYKVVVAEAAKNALKEAGAEIYERNLEEAIAAGVFGAPFYVADSGQRFWGQDSLDDLDLHLQAAQDTADFAVIDVNSEQVRDSALAQQDLVSLRQVFLA